MPHIPYIRIVPNAHTAVLFIHGICGTPWHFRELIPLVPESYSVVNLLLDGHGQGVLEFSQSSMKKWRQQVQQTVEQLRKNHKRLILVAHSMGSLFSIQQAVEYPEQIRHLFFLGSALSILPKPTMFSMAARVFIRNVRPDDARTLQTQAVYGLEPDFRLWRYYGWPIRFIELFLEARRTRKIYPRLCVPVQFYQSKKDEVVNIRATRFMAKNPQAKVTVLPGSGHVYYPPEDNALILSEFQALMHHLQETERKR